MSDKAWPSPRGWSNGALMPFPKLYSSGFPSQIESPPEELCQQKESSQACKIHTLNQEPPIHIHLMRRTDITLIRDEQLWDSRSKYIMRDRDGGCCWHGMRCRWVFRLTVEAYCETQPEANQENGNIIQDGIDAPAFPQDLVTLIFRNFFVFWFLSRHREYHGWWNITGTAWVFYVLCLWCSSLLEFVDGKKWYLGMGESQELGNSWTCRQLYKRLLSRKGRSGRWFYSWCLLALIWCETRQRSTWRARWFRPLSNVSWSAMVVVEPCHGNSGLRIRTRWPNQGCDPTSASRERNQAIQAISSHRPLSALSKRK